MAGGCGEGRGAEAPSIDVCADRTGRDARQISILNAMATQVPVPICIDSNLDDVQAGLRNFGGRAW
jgi:cobalamin-dependent methionine synthase I